MLWSTDVSKMLKWVHIDNTVFSLFNVKLVRQIYTKAGKHE